MRLSELACWHSSCTTNRQRVRVKENNSKNLRLTIALIYLIKDRDCLNNNKTKYFILLGQNSSICQPADSAHKSYKETNPDAGEKQLHKPCPLLQSKRLKTRLNMR